MTPFDLSPKDEAEIARELRAEERRNAWKGLKALWGPAIPNSHPRGGFERNRDEEWTFWRALIATIAIILWRYWSDDDERRYKQHCARHPFGLTVAYFDSHKTYEGYEVMIVQLFPGVRISIFSDGECLM